MKKSGYLVSTFWSLIIFCTLTPSAFAKSQVLIDEITNFKLSIFGEKSHWQWSDADKDKFIKQPDRLENNSSMPLLTYMSRYYQKADKKGWYDWKFPANFERLNMATASANAIKSKVLTYISNTSEKKSDRQEIASLYLLGVEQSLKDIQHILLLDKELIPAITIPSDLITSDKTWLSAIDFEVTELGGGKFGTKLSSTQDLIRQIEVLALIPTSEMFLRMSKLVSLQTFLHQIALYTQVTGDRDRIYLPVSCGAMINGNMPFIVPMNLGEELSRRAVTENILMNNGLMIYPTDPAKVEIYNAYVQTGIDNYSPSFTGGTMDGLAPFESYLASKSGSKDMDPSTAAYERPLIDVISYFHQIVESKLGALVGDDLANMRNLKQLPNVEASYRALLERQIGELENILDELTTQDDKSPLNKFLAKRLADAKLEFNGWENLIDGQDVNVLTNNIINLYELPAFESSWQIKRWAFIAMLEHLDTFLDGSPDTSDQDILFWPYRTAIQACMYTPQDKKPDFCSNIIHPNGTDDEAAKGRALLVKFREALSPYAIDGENLPTHLEHDPSLRKLYSFMQRYWQFISGYGQFKKFKFIPEAQFSEMDYLYSQIEFNKLAQWRVSYLVWKKEKSKYTEKTQQMVEKIFAGLKINQAVGPYWAKSILSENEQKQLWRQVKGSLDENNAYVMNTPVSKQDDQREFYDILMYLQQQNVLDKSLTMNIAQSLVKNISSSGLYTELSSLFDSKQGKNIQSLLAAWRSRSNPEAQRELILDLLRQGQWKTLGDLKREYMILDSKIRAPLYIHVMKEASFLQRDRTLQAMDQLCQLDHRKGSGEIQKHISLTVKAQNQLQQQYGIEMPQRIRDIAQGMNQQETLAFWFGIGAGVFSIISVVTLGLAAPITAPLAATMAIAALSLDTVAFGLDLDTYLKSQNQVKDVEFFTSLGASNDSGKTYVERSVLTPILGAVSIIPDLGMVRLSGKMAINTMKAYNRGLFKAADAASRNLVFASIKKQLNLDLSRKLLKWNRPVANGAIFDASKEFTPYIHELKSLDGHVAKKVAAVFDNSMLKFKTNYFDKYIGQYLKKAVKQQTRYSKLIAIQKETARPANAFNKIRIWMLEGKMKGYQLAIKDFSDVTALKKELEFAISRGTPLDQFINENMTVFSRVIPHLKTGLFESPMFQASKLLPTRGIVPLFGNELSKIPGLGRLFDGPMIKRAILARNNIALDIAENIAKRELGLSGETYKGSFALYQKFQGSLIHSMEKMSEDEAATVLSKWELAEDGVANKVWSKMSAKNQKVYGTVENLKQLIRNGDSKAQAVFNAVKPTELFGLTTFRDTAHHVALELASFDGLNQFDRYLNAVKILSINDAPDLINVLM